MSEKRKVADLKDENKKMNSTLYNTQKKADILEEAHFKHKETREQERNKIKSLEKARDQLQELLQWERSNGHNGDKLNNLLEKLVNLEKDLSNAMEDLENKEVKVQGLTEQLQYFDFMKAEVVRLSAESKRRDMMLIAIIQAISGDASSMQKAPVQNAKVHVDGMARLLGLDLAGFDSTSGKANLLQKVATKAE
jgi:DNA repair exonuclease SbcCD ATPase subunit